MKYIVLQINGLEQIIIFGKAIGHDEIARNFRGKPLSAGFITSDWKTYGESISLDIKSREEDQRLLDIIRSL